MKKHCGISGIRIPRNGCLFVISINTHYFHLSNLDSINSLALEHYNKYYNSSAINSSTPRKNGIL